MPSTIQHTQPPRKPPLSVRRQIEAGARELKRRQGGLSLLDRLRAKNGGRSCIPSHLDDLPGLFQRLEDRSRLEFEAFCRSHPHLADDDDEQPVATPPRRRRRSSVTALIKHARKAGERGPVRVELPDGTAITSNSEPVAGQSDDDAERLWLERIAKNAAH